MAPIEIQFPTIPFFADTPTFRDWTDYDDGDDYKDFDDGACADIYIMMSVCLCVCL